MNFFLQPESCDVRSGRADGSNAVKYYVLITGVSPKFKQRVAVAHQVDSVDGGLAFAERLKLSNPNTLHEAGLYVSGVILDTRLTEDVVTTKSKTIRALTPEEMASFRRDMRFREFYSKMLEAAGGPDPAAALVTILREAERYATQAGYVDVLPGLSSAFDRVTVAPAAPATPTMPIDPPWPPAFGRAPAELDRESQPTTAEIPTVPARAAADAPRPGAFPTPSTTRSNFSPPLQRPAPPVIPQPARPAPPAEPSVATTETRQAPVVKLGLAGGSAGFSPPSFGGITPAAAAPKPAAPKPVIMGSRFSGATSRPVEEDAGNPTMDDGGHVAP